MPDQIPTEGRIVHVRASGVSHCQPAIVVRNWGATGHAAINVAIFRDGTNDHEAPEIGQDHTQMVAWGTSIAYRAPESTEPEPDYADRTWHWPERV